MVPAKHRVDSFRELGVVRFVDATGVDPKVLQAIASDLFSAEPDLVVARLTLAGTIHQVFEADFFGIRSPRVREYSIPGNVIAN
jgi:hypothetical protein